MKKIFLIILIFFINSSVNADKILDKLNGEIESLDSEIIEINSTDLAKDKEIEKLKKKLKQLVLIANTNNSRIKKDNRNRKKRTKYKGPAEDIYQEFSNNVVYVTDKKEGFGSGFVIEHEGFKIITNWHVVENNKDVMICLKPKVLKDYCDDGSYTGKVIKINKKKDLAMIEVKGLSSKFTKIKFASYKDLRIGETVFAIGHPGGLLWTFSNGMVSQIRPDHKWKYKNSRHFANVIQTNAAINPGNSGGPLFNKDKKLVGVNTFTAEGESLNFAISSDDLIDFIKQVEKNDIEAPYIKKKKKGNTWIKKKTDSSKKNAITEKFPNSKIIDSNKNGITDIWLIDENNDGFHEKALIDMNEDGIIEAVAVDENKNNNFEMIVYDTDLDGNINEAEFDENDDGKMDFIAFDYNQDGEWDKFENLS